MSNGSERPPAGWYQNPGGQRQWWDGSRWTDVYEDTSRTAVATDAEHTPEPGTANGPPESRSRRLLWAFAFAPLLAVAAQAALFQADIKPDSTWWRIAVPAGAAVLLALIAVADLVRLPPLKSDKSWGAIWAFLFPGYPIWRARATSTSYAPFAAWIIILALSVTASGFLTSAAEEKRLSAAVTPTRTDPFDDAQGGSFLRCAKKTPAYWRTRFNFAANEFEERTGKAWTLAGANKRQAAGESTPEDPQLLDWYFKVWEVVVDHPECNSSEDVEEARKQLRER